MVQSNNKATKVLKHRPKGIRVRWAFAAVIITSLAVSTASFSATTLQKAGSRYPDYTSMGQKQWVDIRAKSKNPTSRVYAMLATGEHARALVAAKSFMQKRPGSNDSYLALSTALIMNGDISQAQFFAKQVLKKDAGNAQAHNILGLAKLVNSEEVSDFKESLRYFSKSTSTSSYLNAGHLLLELGSVTRAYATFSQASIKCGECAPALIGMGIAKRRMGDHKSAKGLFEEALDTDPNQYAAKYNLALSLMDGYKRYDDAKELLQEVLQEAPDQYSSIRSRADAVMHLLVRKQLKNVDGVSSKPTPGYVKDTYKNGFGGFDD